ncbi:hypothetical protein ScPMuIL_018271 [Solemya velum]
MSTTDDNAITQGPPGRERGNSDEWLTTRNKRKAIQNSDRPRKRRCASRPLHRALTMTQSSPPPHELKTATKQSKIVAFFKKKTGEIDSVTTDQNAGDLRELLNTDDVTDNIVNQHTPTTYTLEDSAPVEDFECLHERSGAEGNEETNVGSLHEYSAVSDNVSEEMESQREQPEKNLYFEDPKAVTVEYSRNDNISVQEVCDLKGNTPSKNEDILDCLELRFDTHDYTYIPTRVKSLKKMPLDSEMLLSSELSLNLEDEGEQNQWGLMCDSTQRRKPSQPNTELTFSTEFDV